MGTQPRCVQIPTTMRYLGFTARAASVCGSGRPVTLVLTSRAISSSVRCLMNTGLPRHLTVSDDPSSRPPRSTSREETARVSAAALGGGGGGKG